VLLYHRVIDLPTDPQQLAVNPAHFDAHLAMLKQRYHVLTVEEFDHHLLGRKRFPKGAVLLTFDDGYADNHHVARPLLEKHGLQALFYISSGYIGSGREYWWDELERLFLLDRELPATFSYARGGVSLSWSADGEATSVHGQRAYDHLLAVLRTLIAEDRDNILADLREQLNSPTARRTHLPMTGPELEAFVRSPSVVIGAHTMGHSSLGHLTEREQRVEILGSVHELGHLLSGGKRYFSYPFGTGADFNATTEKIAEEAGFAHVAANYPGFVHARSPRFKFPRFLVRDWDGPEFARRMDTFLRG
jgi:peptidoglycan/xylan/chitin deacetylase (PgdA/CDA1 family)